MHHEYEEAILLKMSEVIKDHVEMNDPDSIYSTDELEKIIIEGFKLIKQKFHV